MQRVGPRERLRDQYTWQLQPPFSTLFDGQPWWLARGRTPVDPVAALYELARRLPRVGELRRKYVGASWHGQELRPRLDGGAKRRLADAAFADLGRQPAAIHCLCLIGLRSWPELDLKYQEYWEMSAGKLKGVDCRDHLGQCQALVSNGFTDLLLHRMRRLKLPKGALRFRVKAKRGGGPRAIAAENPNLAAAARERIAAEFRRNRPKAQELENLVAGKARSAFRSGEFIFAVAPDMAHERAVEAFAAAYRREQKQAGLEPQRARWSDWLPAVAQFERDERRRGGSKATAFTRYRRILDGIDFTPQTSRLMQLLVPD